MGVVAIVLAARLLPTSARRSGQRLDLRGVVLLSGGLALFPYGLSEVAVHAQATAPGALWPMVSGGVLVALFVRHALRVPEPLLDLRVLRERGFAAGAGRFVARLAAQPQDGDFAHSPTSKGADMTDSIDSSFAEWPAAERIGDAAKLDELLAEDFVGIGPLGFSLPKLAWIARHNQWLRYDAFDVEELHMRTYGDVAIGTAREAQRGTAFGNPIPEAVQATRVLVRDGKRWRLAAVHMSFVAGTSGAPPIPGAPPMNA